MLQEWFIMNGSFGEEVVTLINKVLTTCSGGRNFCTLL